MRVARDEILADNQQLALDAVDRDGSDANAIAASIAAVGDELVYQLAQVSAASFLDSAEGQALDRLVFDRYGLTRKPAAPAFGTVTFTTPVATAAAFTVPGSTKLSTPDGRQYVTVTAVVFPSGGTSVTANVRSLLAGAKQQAGASLINSIVGVAGITGAPAGLAVVNSSATAGAADAETDPDLRDRARRFWTAARRGTLKALEAGALAVPGVRRATAFEDIDPTTGQQVSSVQVVVADAYTDVLANTNSQSPSYQAQSAAFATTVYNALADVRAAGVFLRVLVAQVVLQPVTLNLHFAAGVDTNAVSNVAQSTVVAKINALRPGATLNPPDLQQAISAIPGLVVQGNEILTPAGSVVPTALQVIRTSLALVTVGAR
jgi:uncharacterized phage protein gp47/JayE